MPYGQQPVEPPETSAFTVSRGIVALRRYQWLIAFFTLAGLGGGLVATRFIEPMYVVNATVFATPTSATGGGRGPVNDGALTQNAGWRDLLKSYSIVDPVVVKLALYLQPKEASDSLLFTSFTLGGANGRFTPGDYTLRTEQGRYTLRDGIGFVNEQGTVGDSVGRTAGFAWVPPARLLGTRSRTVAFKVMTPREASVDILQNRFDVQTQEKSPVIYLVLKGTAAQRPAATLNAMIAQFVDVANELKKRQLVQQSTTLAAQLQASQDRLQGSERQLESYRIATIAKPSEGTAVSLPSLGAQPSVEITQPALNTYSAHKFELESMHRDRVVLEQLAQALRSNDAVGTPDAILSVPTVTRDLGADALRQTVKDLNDKQRDIRQLLQSVTDSNPRVIDAKTDLADLRGRVLPQRLADYIGTLRQRESVIGQQVVDAKQELEEIPTRTMRQGELERERDVAAGIYTRLRGAYAEANLAQQAATPDVKALDPAVTPLSPSNNTAPRLIGAGLVAGLGFGLGLAFLLDLLDSRFRYPEQARHELGLDVLGVVPRFRVDRQSPESVAQIVEAFRSIRMNVRYASTTPSSIALGITSPGPGDGKSLVASNLALSFAEGGWRTVLVDADTRRGQLNTSFDIPMSPGLVDYLEGVSLLSEVLHPTRNDNLTLMPCGTRHRRAPELLATPRMPQLVAALSGEFDVIIIDTPPLGAGTDAYAVGTACGQLAVVLRDSRTNIKMAKAKLAVVNQLPITVLGAVLNEIRTDSAMYQYYSYDAEYVLAEEAPALAAGSGAAGTAVAVNDR